jgi:purine-binding chemotaxis protein CheW
MTPDTFAEAALALRAAAASALFSPAAPASPVEAPPAKVLRFRLGGEPYAIDILAVREIRSFEEPLPIPGAGDDLRGVIDLRGTVVPVIDLRLRVGHSASGLAAAGAVIVVDLAGRLVGAIVDAVEEVHELSPGQLRPAPPLGLAPVAAHLTALASIEGRLVQLLDIGGLLAGAPRSAAAH